MTDENLTHTLTNNPQDVPVPVVVLSRWVYVIILTASLVAQIPLGTTLLLALLVPSLFFGKKWNIIGRVGTALLKSNLNNTEYEDRRLIHFNNVLLVIMLSASQFAFIAGVPMLAWSIIGTVIGVTGLALSGFCIGCVLYYRFKLYRYRFSPRG